MKNIDVRTYSQVIKNLIGFNNGLVIMKNKMNELESR